MAYLVGQKTLRSNISKEEGKALTELKKDKDQMVLTADKGVAMVVLDKEEYQQKAENLLGQSVYNTIERNPTDKIKAKHIQPQKNKKVNRYGSRNV